MINLTEIFDSYLVARNAKRTARDNGHFHGSDTGKCMRMRILQRAGRESTPMTAGSLWNFYMGDQVEDFMRCAFRAQNIIEAEQVTVKSPDGQTVGHYDFKVILVGNNGFPKTGLIDCKSCQASKIDIAKKGKPQEEYRMQTAFYDWGDEFSGNRPADFLAVAYVAKNTRGYYLDVFAREEYRPKVRLDHEELMAAWKAYLTDKSLPTELPLLVESTRRYRNRVTPNGGGLIPQWKCDYCNYYLHCPRVKTAYEEFPAARPKED